MHFPSFTKHLQKWCTFEMHSLKLVIKNWRMKNDRNVWIRRLQGYKFQGQAEATGKTVKGLRRQGGRKNDENREKICVVQSQHSLSDSTKRKINCLSFNIYCTVYSVQDWEFYEWRIKEKKWNIASWFWVFLKNNPKRLFPNIGKKFIKAQTLFKNCYGNDFKTFIFKHPLAFIALNVFLHF